ncbi:MAG: CopD family protein [Candidatus Nitrosotenuis sp.]
MKKILAIAVLFFVSVIPFASAHPLIEDSNPRASTNVSAGITQITIHYSEPVDLKFSEIKVLDNTGMQVDNKDTSYLQGDEKALIVTTPPLQDGVYTVTTAVLSKIDGHRPQYAFVFGIGNVELPPPPKTTIEQEVYFPEAAARFPGLVGQVIVLGSAVSILLVWRGIKNRSWIKEDSDFQKFFHSKFSTITGIGLFAVFASNILMLVIQTIRLKASASDVLDTDFGMIWEVRMGITVVLLAVWFLLENKTAATVKKQLLVLGLSLALIGTTTAIGHGAASEQAAAMAIDYAHNLIASVWIGGVIFFGFILIPAFSKLDKTKKEIASLLMIPRFSSMIIVSLGIVLITGPTLLWFLSDDITMLSQSYYGWLIIGKIAIGTAMVALGGYNQFKIQKPAEKSLDSAPVHQRLKKSLRIEAVLGIVLLGVVALLTNTSLPSQAEQTTQAPDGFNTFVFSEDLKFAADVYPLKSGTNKISVSVYDSNGDPVQDAELKIKISNPQKNIAPIQIPLEKTGNSYQGDITFGFAGSWNVEIDTNRKDNPNQSTGFSVVIKPRLAELRTDITEYTIPEKAAPLYPVYDGKDTIWLSDASQPRLWKFSISQKQFTPYKFDGQTTVFLKLYNDKVWFTDTPNGKIGYFDTKTEQFQIIPLPIKSVPIALEFDSKGKLWVGLADQDTLLRYDPDSGQFGQYKLPTSPAGPAFLTRDQNGMIWFVESQAGKIGVIDPNTAKILEFAPKEPLKDPTYLLFDKDGTILVSDHVALDIVRFNPYLETFSPVVKVSDPNALPFALAPDKFENLWIAQHTSDKLGIYDSQKREFQELTIPSQGTFVQFLTNDNNGDIWFVEQRTNKLGHVSISENTQIAPIPKKTSDIGYFELVTPLITVGIIATSLFFVKSIQDKRRLDSALD